MEEKIKEEIAKLEEEYKQLNNTINETIEKYNNTIRQVQAEGQAVVDDLRIKREGKFQAIESLKNMLDNGADNKGADSSASIEVSEEKKDTTKKPTRRVQEKKEIQDKKNIPNLTPEELTNLQGIVNNQEPKVTKVNSIKEEDIPDYLKDEYKK